MWWAHHELMTQYLMDLPGFLRSKLNPPNQSIKWQYLWTWARIIYTCMTEHNIYMSWSFFQNYKKLKNIFLATLRWSGWEPSSLQSTQDSPKYKTASHLVHSVQSWVIYNSTHFWDLTVCILSFIYCRLIRWSGGEE